MTDSRSTSPTRTATSIAPPDAPATLPGGAAPVSAFRAPAPTESLTLLFTDIEGSTVLVQRLGAAGYVEIQSAHNALVRAAIAAHGGRELATHGDAFFAVFATATDGLGAAMAAQRALADHAWPADGAVRVRMGLHTGRARPTAEGFVGVDVNRAARICDAANGGQVFVSAATAEAVGLVESSAEAAEAAGRVEAAATTAAPVGLRMRDLGEHRLKDLRFAERLLQVVADGLPDVTLAPRTAGEVTTRDRIVVLDPAAPADDPSRLDASPTVVERTVAETLAALLAVVRGDARTVVLTPEQVRAAARHRPADWTEFRLGRVAEWSQPHYRLDGRFVDLALLVDQGEDAASGRWAARQERFDDLGALLAAVPEPAVVVLGPPGSGKSTLLRRLELDAAIAGVRAGEVSSPIPFFIQLNQYKSAAPGQPLPAPGDWLAARWAERFPDLPALDGLLGAGRMVLLLDALNEMPAASDREFRASVGLWKDWLVALAVSRPGNRAVFSCRTLDYSAPLSTPALRVPQVQIEALSDDRVRAFLRLYSPARGADIWAAIAGTPQLDALRAPFFLALLVDQVETSGDVAGDRAGLFTGFVRQSLRREVERGSPLFAGVGAKDLSPLLASRDVRRIARWQWRDAYELPERGALVPRLSALAYGMQERDTDGEGGQVRVDYDAALALIDHPRDADIVRAGVSIAVLDEDPAADEVLYRHQLIQEYFAARALARAPRPERAAAPWRAADIRPSVRELIDTLPPAETLPPLPQSGWEETTVLAAVLAEDPAEFIRGLMAANLPLAGRCAVQPRVRERLPADLLHDLRWALVGRSRDAGADLRARIAAGLALGWLGDPRFERRVGPYGEYLLPPVIEIPGGVYPIGEDQPIVDPATGKDDRAHMPRHDVAIAGFAVGQLAVTNAEYAHFMAAGGYDDERWWETAAGLAWQRGETTAEGPKRNARDGLRLIREIPRLLEEWHKSGQMDDDIYERWQMRLAMTEAELEAHLAKLYPGGRESEPRWWRDERFNHPSQPVVGISWYEARAYCAWLSAQTGHAWRLPTEVEIEATARGLGGRHHAYGGTFDAAKGNMLETRLKRPTPGGVFVEGDTPEGVGDTQGNVDTWTSSLWGVDPDEPDFTYPFVGSDGRENLEAPPGASRVVRGGSWYSGVSHFARACFRNRTNPDVRSNSVGFRLIRPAPNP